MIRYRRWHMADLIVCVERVDAEGGVAMNVRWVVLVLVVFGCGCAAVGNSEMAKTEDAQDEAVLEHNAAAEPEDRVVCSRERVSGTNIARKVCRTERQIEAEREHAREAMDEIRRTVGDSSSGGIGG
jgi:hypothetical protein